MHRAEGRWNHNIHHHGLVLDAVPAGARRVLDVGCGEGLLTRELATRAAAVMGIDADTESIELARARPHPGVTYVLGDVLTQGFARGSFDLVAAVAVLHHLGDEEGLRCLSELVAPGGSLVVIGLARPSYPADLPWVISGSVLTRWHAARHGYWQHGAPTVWPPPLTFAQTRAVAARVLPDARYRRHVLWRYSLVWTRSRSEAPAARP